MGGAIFISNIKREFKLKDSIFEKNLAVTEKI